MDKMEKSKYKSYSKTIPAHVDFEGDLREGIAKNVFSEVYRENGEGLYKGPNYFIMIKEMGDNSKEIKIESLGIPKNKNSLQDLLKMRFE